MRGGGHARRGFRLALDGDADRVDDSDEKGRLLDGDQLMALVANSWCRARRLVGCGVVATVMSNLGLEIYLKQKGIVCPVIPVGDRYVVEKMRADGYNVGGEQSGHIIPSDYATTGDGLDRHAARAGGDRRATSLRAKSGACSRPCRNC